MSINIKKYTKDQMAKMVEDAQEKTAALEAEITELKNCIDAKNDLISEYANLKAAMQRKNVALTEQVSQMNGEAINKANEIANLKADADMLRVQIENVNDTTEAVSKELQRVNLENDGLRNKLTDTEAVLERANAVADQNASALERLHIELCNAEQRADYAERHPWRNLWAWVERRVARHE